MTKHIYLHARRHGKTTLARDAATIPTKAQVVEALRNNDVLRIKQYIAAINTIAMARWSDEQEEMYWLLKGGLQSIERGTSRDAGGEYGVQYRQANKSGSIQTKEKTFQTQAQLDAFVKKVENEDGFIEFVSWLSPKTKDSPPKLEQTSWVPMSEAEFKSRAQTAGYTVRSTQWGFTATFEGYQAGEWTRGGVGWIARAPALDGQKGRWKVVLEYGGKEHTHEIVASSEEEAKKEAILESRHRVVTFKSAKFDPIVRSKDVSFTFRGVRRGTQGSTINLDLSKDSDVDRLSGLVKQMNKRALQDVLSEIAALPPARQALPNLVELKRATQSWMSVADAKNHLGEREYQTYAAWRAAAKAAGATRFEGDKDIAHAIGPDGKHVGEWGGDVGSIYTKDAYQARTWFKSTIEYSEPAVSRHRLQTVQKLGVDTEEEFRAEVKRKAALLGWERLKFGPIEKTRDAASLTFIVAEVEHSGDEENSIADLRRAGCSNIQVTGRNYDNGVIRVTCTPPPGVTTKQQLEGKLTYAILDAAYATARDATITQLTSSAGIAYKKPNAAVTAKFKELGGRVGAVTDKSVELIFPTDAAAREFQAFARAQMGSHAQFDSAMARDEQYPSVDAWKKAVLEKYPNAKISESTSVAVARVDGKVVATYSYHGYGTIDADKPDPKYLAREMEGIKERYAELRAKKQLTREEADEQQRLKRKIDKFGTGDSTMRIGRHGATLHIHTSNDTRDARTLDATLPTLEEVKAAAREMNVPKMKAMRRQLEAGLTRMSGSRESIQERIDILTEAIQSA